MLGTDPLAIGITLVVLALAFAGGVVIFSRRVLPRVSSLHTPPASPPEATDIPSNTDAVMIVQIGGRVIYTNKLAREWFGHLEEEPNLERLARRARPSEVFLGLCHSEGLARFSFDGRFVEGSSYYIPPTNGSSGAFLVSLRHPQVTDLASGERQITNRALDIFAELNQSMASSLDLETTLRTILESVEHLVPSDFPEITVWDAEAKKLIPYHFMGMTGVDRHVEKSTERYEADEGYSGYLVSNQKALFINDVDAFREVKPVIESLQYPINSFLGIPLIVAGEVVGTLELASLSKNAFTEADLEVLRVLSGQAAIALNNAKLFQAEQQRLLELSGLAKLAQTSGVTSNAQDFFAQLLESITPLLEVKTLGFLIYDESRRRLKAQQPFNGLPGDFADLYQITLPPESPAEAIWSSQQMIVSLHAAEDEYMEALGLAHFALAAGLQNSILVPLTSAGRMVGYLQAADKRDGSPFDQDDLRLLTIIAGQAGAIIENVTLVRQSQERAQRSESMRRIASLTGSEATIDEILIFSMRELAHLLRADTAAILLVDENLAELRIHKDSLYGVSSEAANLLSRISLNGPDFHLMVTGTQKPFFSDDARADVSLVSIYQPFAEALQLKSLIIVPIVARDRGIGEMMLGSREAEFFDRNDLILLSTTASQLVAAIEKSRLYTQTDESLRRHVEQLLALSRVSRELNSRLDLQHLMEFVYEELLHTTQATCGEILLFEIEGSKSNSRKFLLNVGDAPPEQLSLPESHMLEQGEPLLINDYTQPVPELDGNVIQPPHDGVRASMIVPIIYQEHTAGLIHLHAMDPGFFDATSVEIAQSLATQAAIALGNAMLYQEQIQRSELLSRRVETMTNLLEISKSLSLGQPLESALEAIAYGIQESTPFSVVLISEYNATTGHLERKAAAGIPLDTFQDMRRQSQPWSAIQQLLADEFKFSSSYFIPFERRRVTPADLHIHEVMTVLPGDMEGSDELAWHPQDMLLVPLRDMDGNPLGLISVDAPKNKLRPDLPTIETIEVFASQAALTIESHQRLNELGERAEGFEKELHSTRLAVQSAQNHLPVLLHKDLEQTIAIQSLSERSRRNQAGLDIAEIVNRQTERAGVISAFGREILTHMGMDLVLLAEPSSGGPHLIEAIGGLPATGLNLESLLGQRNPLRNALQSGEAILVPDIEENAEWKESPLLHSLEAGTFVCLPVMVDGEVDFALLGVSKRAVASGSTEDLHLYDLVCRQVAVALKNLRLLNETNRRLQEVNLLLEFSRQLGSLDPVSILRTLVDSAISAVPGAQAGMVALWEADKELLIPKAATGYRKNERILEITYPSGQSLAGLVFERGEALRVDEVNFAQHYALSSEQLLVYRDAMEGRLPISSLILPILTGENRLGVLVLDNFKTTGAFTAEDQALIASLTRQTALTLENVRLYQAAEQRAAQLLALTNVAGTITSSLQTDDLIDSLLDQVRVILPYDTGTLWLRQGGKLTIRAASGFADSEQRIGLSVAVEDSLLLKEMVETSRPISVGDVREDVRFSSLIEHQYLSWLGVPLLSKGEVVGVLAFEKIEPHYYTQDHISSIITFAGQAAVALVNARLYEESVSRAVELDERSQRLALLNRLSDELSSSLDADYILKVAIRELNQAMTCSLVSAVLFDLSNVAYLRAEFPDRGLEYPQSIPDNPIFERLRETLGVFSTEDVRQEENLTSLIDFLTERETQALLILPLVTGNTLHGLLMIHSNQPNRFAGDEVELSRTISNQVSVAIQNARLFAETERLFDETQQRRTELATLFDMGVNITQVLDQQKLIETTFENTTRLVRADSVGLVMLGEDDTLLIRVLDQGKWIGPTSIPRQGTSFSEHVLATGEPLIIRDMDEERENLPVQGYTVGDPVKSWLGVPLRVRNTTVGVISIHSYHANAFGEAQIRLLEQVGNQLAVALDNARLFETVQNYTAELEQRVSERTRELETEHNRTQTLLGIITELSASLDLDLVLTRTLAVINEAIGSEHSLIMLRHPDEPLLYLRASLGYATPPPKGGKESTIKSSEGLAGWVIVNRQPALVPDLLHDERWKPSSRKGDQHRCAMAVPLMMGEENLGVLMLYHRQPDYFTQAQLELVQATAKQIAVAINNAQLFNLIRDQAERLGDMLRTQHIETSRSQAILEAVADGVLVTDSNREITLFNASAERILGLERRTVLGHSLENFIGLFGKAAQSWVHTIHTWSEDPSSYKEGESYAEQIELDDRRVVSVHLSPVLLRNDFLGTVSIFQDITHMIEVDRLKSEFVATVSHELRTPMTSIKGYVEVLLMGAGGPLSEQQLHFLQVVKSNTERLAILVNDLLDVSRIEAGRVTLSLQPLDLYQIVKDSVNVITRRMQEENRTFNIQIDLPPDLPSAYGDKERVQQILDTLVENAYQYTPENGNAWISVHQEGDEIQVDVRDNGIGILPHEQARIFERFFRGEDPLVLATPGTGLGLSIVKHLVEMHHGRIWFNSRGIPGDGSIFSFTIPIYTPEKVDEG